MLNFSLYFSNIQHSHIKNLLDRLPSTLEKAISDRRFLVSKLIGAWCRLIRGAWKTSCEREVDRRERGSFPDDGMAFQSRRTIFFFCPGNLDEKSRAQRWSMRSLIHRGEKGRIRTYIYILDALSGRNAATDLHQGNHDDTSYEKLIRTGETRIYRDLDVYNWAPSDELFYIPSPPISGFLVGCEQQKSG